MPIDLVCESCGRKLSIKDEFAGRRGSCAHCGAIIAVPDGSYEVETGPARVIPVPPVASLLNIDLSKPLGSEPLPGGPGQLAAIRARIAVGVLTCLVAIVTIGLYYAITTSRPSRAGRTKVAKSQPTVVPSPVAERVPVQVARIASEVAVKGPAKEPIIAPIQAPASSPTAPNLPLGVEQIVARCEAAVAVVRGPDSTGSGFLVSPGLLATNAHVIRRIPARDIRVSFPSAPKGQQGPHQASVVYFADDRDLAILAVDSRLPPLEVNRSHVFRRGQEVVYIGNPVLGGTKILESVAGRGVLGSRVSLDDLDYYQLSGSVNGGNSGGPVIDMEGRVIGVVTARASKEEGIGFCIPATDLASAIGTAAGRNASLQADAATRHADTVRLTTIRVAKSSAIDRGDEAFASEFMKTRGPATWMASVDSNLILKDTSPQVVPFRNSLRRVDTIYLEDDRTIAVLTIQFATKVRNAGMPISCALMLDCAQTWAPVAYIRGSTQRSFQEFAESYCTLRINERLDHRATVVRMQEGLASKPAPAAQQKGDKLSGADNKAATNVATKAPAKVSDPAPGPPRPINPDSPAGKLEAAKSLEASGNKDAAVFGYQIVIEKFPLTSQADEAKKRLKKLNGGQ